MDDIIKKNITLNLKNVYLTTFILGILTSISSLFLNTSVTSSFVKSTFGIDLNDYYMNILNILHIDLIAGGIVVAILSSLLYIYAIYHFGKYIKLEIETDPKTIIISSLLVVGFIILLFSIFLQSLYVQNLGYTLNGLSNDQILELKYGGDYIFVKNSTYLIPENDNVLVIFNSSTPVFTNYYLYPRKLYMYPNLSESLADIDNDWIRDRNIKWVIFQDNRTVAKIGDENV